MWYCISHDDGYIAPSQFTPDMTHACHDADCIPFIDNHGSFLLVVDTDGCASVENLTFNFNVYWYEGVACGGFKREYFGENVISVDTKTVETVQEAFRKKVNQ
jgi:hypothetical protein